MMKGTPKNYEPEVSWMIIEQRDKEALRYYLDKHCKRLE